jgi:hypothetical protein
VAKRRFRGLSGKGAAMIEGGEQANCKIYEGEITNFFLINKDLTKFLSSL